MYRNELPIPSGSQNYQQFSKVYRHVLSIDNEWRELACKICGANYNGRTDNFFDGLAGFKSHLKFSHQITNTYGKLIFNHIAISKVDPNNATFVPKMCLPKGKGAKTGRNSLQDTILVSDDPDDFSENIKVTGEGSHVPGPRNTLSKAPVRTASPVQTDTRHLVNGLGDGAEGQYQRDAFAVNQPTTFGSASILGKRHRASEDYHTHLEMDRDIYLEPLPYMSEDSVDEDYFNNFLNGSIVSA